MAENGQKEAGNMGRFSHSDRGVPGMGHPQYAGIVSPYLKWVGAKTRSMPALLAALPSPEYVECLIELYD